MEITRHEIAFYKLSQKLATNKTSFINKKTCKYNRHKYIMALAAHNSVERGKAVQLKPIIFIRDNEIQTKVKLNFLSSNLISNYLYLLFYVFIYAVYKEYTIHDPIFYLYFRWLPAKKLVAAKTFKHQTQPRYKLDHD